MLDDDALLSAYRTMLLIRRMEQRIGALYAAGAIPGFVHTSVGQEACAVGATTPLRPADVLTSTHRGHGHVLARGLPAREVMAELLGRESGTCRGRGGSMHVADPHRGILGANGIVGAGLPIAVGAAQSFRARGTDQVALAIFGDGAVATGAFHESVNLAALWRLPVVFFCENNGFSEFSPAQDQHPVPVVQRAAAYGIAAQEVDGRDVEAVADVVAQAVGRARAGHGPTLVEAHTLRVGGHYEGDQQRYRDAAELPGQVRAADPVEYAASVLRGRGVDEATLASVEAEVTALVADAESFAQASPVPTVTVPDDVYAPRKPAPVPAPPRVRDPALSQSRILRQAFDDALADDPDVFLAGIDVAGGNVFGLTRGLAQKYPGRLLDTPISETAVMGLAVGSALQGMRPVVELMYLDFLGVCLDQLMNQAAKFRLMSGGRVSVPMVVHTQFGSGRSSGAQHSQSLEALLAHIPGLTVVMPSNGTDAYGLLRTAIEDDNPVVFIENRLLYEVKDALPGPEHRVPLGLARVARPGESVTVVAWSRMVLVALAAAEQVAPEGIDVEVVDLRTIAPLDRETVLTSFRKTSRMVIAQEAVVDFGVGAELAALAVSDGFWSLDAPVLRVGGAATPVPYAPGLEQQWAATQDDVVAAIRKVMAW